MNTRWTQADVAKALNKAPRSKYGSKKVQIDGIWFDSKVEGARYVELKMMQSSGLISDLTCHPVFPIGIKGIFICDVELDFKYLAPGYSLRDWYYEDVKGKDNSLSALKRKLVEAEYGITVELVK